MKDIEGYEGLYAVTEDGRVWRFGRYGVGRRNSGYQKQGLLKRGYRIVSLTKDGIKRRFLVHRLVARAFIENPYHLPQVNHKNGCKSDNRTNNLEWCTGEENRRHSKLNRLQPHGENAKISRLKEYQAKEILNIKNPSPTKIARDYGVSRGAIEALLKRRSWTHLN